MILITFASFSKCSRSFSFSGLYYGHSKEHKKGNMWEDKK